MQWQVEGTRKDGRSARIFLDAKSEAEAKRVAAGHGVVAHSVVQVEQTAAEPEPPAFGWARCRRCQRIRLSVVFAKDKACKGCRRIERAARAAAARRREEEERDRQSALTAQCRQEISAEMARGNGRNVPGVLEKFRGLGLHDDLPARRVVYEDVVLAVSDDKIITPRERQALVFAREVLGLGDQEVGHIDSNLARLETIWAIERGQLPVVPSPIPLQKNEVARFVFDGVSFHQERVLGRECVGRSQSVSIRLAKGITYRVGATRGQCVTHTGVVFICSGSLILTSKRLVFSGPKSFSVPLLKILNANAYSDGFSIVKDSTAQNNKPFFFIYGDAELLNLAVSACLNAVA